MALNISRKGKSLISLLPILLVVFVLSSSIVWAASSVKITKFQYNASGTDTHSNTSVNKEYIVLKNISSKTLNMTGWLIKDKQSHKWYFPSLNLGKGKSVTVHTGKGTNTSSHLYMKYGYHIWNNTGDTFYLYDNRSPRRLILKKSY
jgi:hypothetical protein